MKPSDKFINAVRAIPFFGKRWVTVVDIEIIHVEDNEPIVIISTENGRREWLGDYLLSVRGYYAAVDVQPDRIGILPTGDNQTERLTSARYMCAMADRVLRRLPPKGWTAVE